MKTRTKKLILGWTALGVMLLLITAVLSAALGGTTSSTTPVNQVSTHSVTPGPKPSPSTIASTAASKIHIAPTVIKVPGTTQARTTAPVTSHPAAVVTTPAVTRTTPKGCYPLSNEGTCYRPGEYCRDTDHGVTGISKEGLPITCKDNNGWRWEAT